MMPCSVFQPTHGHTQLPLTQMLHVLQRNTPNTHIWWDCCCHGCQAAAQQLTPDTVLHSDAD